MRPSEKILRRVRRELAARTLPDIMDKEQFIENLCLVWHMMKASERLLRSAVEFSTGGLQDYFKEHLKEEEGHEYWLSSDLYAAGVYAENSPLPTLVPPMVGEVYYYIFHRDAAALLGYMLVMEGTPMPITIVEMLEKQHGGLLCRTLRYHAENDPKHAEDLLYVIDNLSPERQEIVKEIALSTSTLYSLCLFRIAEKRVSHG